MGASSGKFAVADYLSVTSAFDFTASKWTVAGWYYIDTEPTTFAACLGTDDALFFPMYRHLTESNFKSFLNTTLDSGQALALGEWVFLAVTWDSATKTGNLRQYYGEPSQVVSLVQTHSSVTYTASPTAFQIGKYSTTHYLDGYAAYVGIYSSQLSLPELQDLQYKPDAIKNAQEYLVCYNNTDAPEKNVGPVNGDFTVNGTVSSSGLGPPVYFP